MSKQEELRKLQFTGKSSFIVSLPKEWVRDHGLKQGDQVAVGRNGSSILEIKPMSVSKPSNQESATITITNNDNDASILRNLRAKGLVASVPSQDHDDDYWLQFAWQKGAYVVTNDRMKDHAEKFPSEDSEDFFKWRDEKVISYTFVGDDFFPNPSIKIPLVTKNDETINPKKSKEVPSVRKSRAVFRSIIRDRLSKGPVNCGMLASEVNDLFSEKSNHDFKNRKELMKSMNVSKTNFHEQLTELMGDELIVELVKGQPVDVKLVNSSKAKGKNKASNKANKKPCLLYTSPSPRD